jgi:hypothetical protein
MVVGSVTTMYSWLKRFCAAKNPATVAVLELAQGNFELHDGRGQTRAARQQFVNVATVKSGIFVKGAPQASN